MLLQHVSEPGASHIMPQALQCFEHWEIRFARAMLFNTLPVGHCQVPIGGALGKQGLDQGRFANPCFSSDEHYLSVPTCCPGEPGMELPQLRLAPYEKWWCGGKVIRWREGKHCHVRSRHAWWGRSDRSDEAVSPPWGSGNKLWTLSIIS